MVAHRHFARQDPITAPSADGITNSAVTITSGVVQSTGLAFDPNAPTGTISAPPLAFTSPPVSDDAPTTVETTSSSDADPSPTAVSASSSAKPIAISTVIGTCVGAFIGASALILFGLWIYRRYSQSLKKRSNARGPLIHARSMQNNKQQRRSRLEAWNRLEDGEDKWEAMNQTKERKDDQVAPMEKLTMFKKTPSVRTAYTHKTTDNAALHFPPSFAQFDPNLAASLNVGQNQEPPEPRPYLGRIESEQQVVSWDGDETKSSYFSIQSREGGAMSPSLQMAIPTPPPTFHQLHRWESAEVINYSEGQTAQIIQSRSSTDDEDSRKSVSNPFFNARDHESPRQGRTRSRSNSARSRSRSRSASRSRGDPPVKSANAKGKERMRYSLDPFDDMNEHMPARPPFIQHTATSSTSSMEKDQKERALQSLIAALDTPEEEVRNRLRIASMQQSIISQTSTIGPDVTNDFPLPPSSPGKQ